MKLSAHKFGDDDDDETIPPEIKMMLQQVVNVASVAGIVAVAARLDAFLRMTSKAELMHFKFANDLTRDTFAALCEELFCRLKEAGYSLHGDPSYMETGVLPPEVKLPPKNVNLPPQNHPSRN